MLQDATALESRVARSLEVGVPSQGRRVGSRYLNGRRDFSYLA